MSSRHCLHTKIGFRRSKTKKKYENDEKRVSSFFLKSRPNYLNRPNSASGSGPCIHSIIGLHVIKCNMCICNLVSKNSYFKPIKSR